MTAPSFALPTLQVAAAPPSRPAADAAARAGSSDNTAFARELNRAREGDTAPSAPDAPRAQDKPAAPGPAHAAQRGGPGRGHGRAAADGAAKDGPAPSASATKGASDEAAADAGTDTVEGTPVADDLASVIAGLLGLPGTPPAATTPAASGASATSDAAGAAGGPPAATPGVDPAALATLAGVGAVRSAGAGGPPAGTADSAIGAADAGDRPAPRQATEPPTAARGAVDPEAVLSGAAEPRTAGRSEVAVAAATAEPAANRPSIEPTASHLPGATPNAPLPGQGPAASGATPTTTFEARLHAALGSPDFAPALGQQISVLVQGGVQHARLHLNPAEMGPITVQIAVEGATAQVHLAAEQPLTRQALEQAMPVLAGALRDSGLQLTGGGVFEQPREAPRDGSGTPQQPGGRRGEGAGEAPDPVLPTLPAMRSLRGAVDLIA